MCMVRVGTRHFGDDAELTMRRMKADTLLKTVRILKNGVTFVAVSRVLDAPSSSLLFGTMGGYWLIEKTPGAKFSPNYC